MILYRITLIHVDEVRPPKVAWRTSERTSREGAREMIDAARKLAKDPFDAAWEPMFDKILIESVEIRKMAPMKLAIALLNSDPKAIVAVEEVWEWRL